MLRLKSHPNVLVEKSTVDTNGSDKQDSNYSDISILARQQLLPLGGLCPSDPNKLITHFFTDIPNHTHTHAIPPTPTRYHPPPTRTTSFKWHKICGKIVISSKNSVNKAGLAETLEKMRENK